MKRLILAFLACVVAPSALARIPASPRNAVAADLARAGVQIPPTGWVQEKPWLCRSGRAPRVCVDPLATWSLGVEVSYDKKRWHLDIWSLEFTTATKAKTWFPRLERNLDRESAIFGKAPVSTWLCGRVVFATVGVFRGPGPHKKLDERVAASLKKRCPK